MGFCFSPLGIAQFDSPATVSSHQLSRFSDPRCACHMAVILSMLLQKRLKEYVTGDLSGVSPMMKPRSRTHY